jgi:predicted glycoside hydrolase/deacetylase ChbG (UPF0249 family)
VGDEVSPAAWPERPQLAAPPSVPAARQVCVCVDDYGLHSGIDGAALRLADMHRVHAISCLVGGKSWEVSSRSLRRFNPGGIDVGLHLDFTEAPLLGASRRSLPELIVASYLRLLDRHLIRAEIRAQLDGFEQAMGRGPAFIDGHQHVHQLPVVRSELLAELQARRRDVPAWIRSTHAPHGRRSAATASPGRFKSRVIEGLGARGLAAAASSLGYPQNQHLLGVYDFKGGRRRYRELLAGWLLSASDGDLLMCHPSLSTRDADPLIDARQAEFDVLSSAGFDADLRANELQLGPMSQMLVLRS